MSAKGRQNKNVARGIAGWAGISLVLIAFILTTFKVIAVEDLLYGALNGLGAIGIIISSLAKRDFQPVVLNIVWLIVALFGVIRSLVA